MRSKSQSQNPAPLTERNSRLGTYLSALLAEPAGVDHAAEEHSGAVLAVGGLAVERLHDAEASVEADEVGEGEGAHGVVHAQPQRLVDVLLGRDALFECHDGFVDERHQQAIRHEAGDVFGGGDLLAACLGEGARVVDDVWARLDRRDELDEGHDGHRVEKVDAQRLQFDVASVRSVSRVRSVGKQGTVTYSSRTLPRLVRPRLDMGADRTGSNLADTDAARVGRQNRLERQARCERAKDLLLDRQVLGRGLDHHVRRALAAAAGKVLQLLHRDEARARSIRVALLDLALADILLEQRLEERDSLLERGGRGIAEEHGGDLSTQRGDVGDPEPHLASTDDAERLDSVSYC